MAMLLEKSLTSLENQWACLRAFSFKNRTIIETLFNFIYALEQVILVILTSLFPNNSLLTISLFAIVVLSTFTLHKQTIESRIRILEGNVKKLEAENAEIIKEANNIQDRYHYWRDSSKKEFGTEALNKSESN